MFVIKLDPITTTTRLGRPQTWHVEVSVEDSGACCQAIDEAWYDGTVQLPVGYVGRVRTVTFQKTNNIRDSSVRSGKNIGKKNSTNVFTQALAEAKAKRVKYAKDHNHDSDLVRPMLARVAVNGTVTDRARDVDVSDIGSHHVQIKYNGMRGMTTRLSGKETQMYTRKLEPLLNSEHVRTQLLELPVGVYLDGELYKHGWSLEEINGTSRRKTAGSSSRVPDYMVYDVYFADEPDMVFSERYERLSTMDIFSDTIILAPTIPSSNIEETMALYDKFLAEGYEGAIVRMNTAYEFGDNNRHSKNLLKLKPTFSDEFKVVDFTQAVNGIAEGSLKYILEAENGKLFTAAFGTHFDTAERKRLYTLMKTDEYFEKNVENRKVTVDYTGRTKNGVPSCAILAAYLPRTDI